MKDNLHELNRAYLVTTIDINEFNCSQVVCLENFITLRHLLGGEQFKKVPLRDIPIPILIEHVEHKIINFFPCEQTETNKNRDEFWK